MGIEYLLERWLGFVWGPIALLSLTVLVAMACEAVRYGCFLGLELGLPGRGGHRYTYYVDYSMSLPLVVPLLAIMITIVSTLMWRRLLTLTPPWNLYAGGAFLLGLFMFVVILLYMARGHLRTDRECRGVDKEKGIEELEQLEMVRLLLMAGAELFFFIFEPTRCLFGGTLLFVVSLAGGKVARVTGWMDLVEWIKTAKEKAEEAQAEREKAQGDPAVAPAAPRRPKMESVRLRIFLEAEAVIATDGEDLEVDRERLITDDGNRAAVLAQHLVPLTPLSGFLDWLVDFVDAQNRIRDYERRENLLEEIPGAIAQHWHRLPGQSEEKKGKVGDKLREAIRDLLVQDFGPRMTSLLYWNYYLPQDEVNFSLCRASKAVLKPILSVEEYLGIPLTYYERRRREQKRR